MDLNKYSPRSRQIRYLTNYLILFIASWAAKIHIKGRHHLPKSGPYVIAINHFSLLDPAFVLYGIQKPVNFLMASDLTIDFVHLSAAWLYGFIPTNRSKLGPSTIKKSVRVLKSGQILGIFPEGTSHANEIRPAKNGAAYLSTVTQCPIVPVGIVGLNNTWSDWFRGVRPVINICIGKPFGPYQLSKGKNEKDHELKNIGDEMMCRIAALVPDQYHGHYHGDPRIKDYRSENL